MSPESLLTPDSLGCGIYPALGENNPPSGKKVYFQRRDWYYSFLFTVNISGTAGSFFLLP
jgi:hypothetical protein